MSAWTLIPVAVILVLDAVFFVLLGAPTRLGQQVRNQIEGFAQYLTGKDRSAYGDLHAEKAAELHHRFLPYAIGLGLADVWTSGLTGALKGSAAEAHRFRPIWYHDPTWHGGSFEGFGSSLGSSLSSAISSSSTAPGSSSGSSGGFSGGGGGGGGGGGW